jgi:hypothetical protein
LHELAAEALAETIGGLTTEALKPLLYRASHLAEQHIKPRRVNFYQDYVRLLTAENKKYVNQPRSASVLSAYNSLPPNVSLAQVKDALDTPTAYGLIRRLAALHIIGADGDIRARNERDADQRRLFRLVTSYLNDVLDITMIPPADDGASSGLGSSRYVAADAHAAFVADILSILNRQSMLAAEQLLRHSKSQQYVISWAQATQAHEVLNSIERYAALAAGENVPSPGERKEWLARYRYLFTKRHQDMTIPDLENRTSVPYEKLYVQPRLRAESGRELGLSNVLDELDRTVILGNPGAGKSTASQFLAMEYIQTRQYVPFILPMKSIVISDDSGFSIIDAITSRIRRAYQLDCPQNLIEQFMTEGSAIIFLDGLDELLDPGTRTDAAAAIEMASLRYPLAKFLVTCRHVGYSQSKLKSELFSEYSILPFDTGQVYSYVTKWFTVSGDTDKGDDQDTGSQPQTAAAQASDFMQASEPISDVRANPLLLSYICIIYRGEGIPPSRPLLFAKCINLLIRAWDSWRKVKTPVPDNTYELALAEVAEFATTNPEYRAGIPANVLRDVLANYFINYTSYSEPKAFEEAECIVDHCKGRAWILSDVGQSDSGTALYEFTHSTFREYFYAWSLTRRVSDSDDLAGHLYDLLREGQSQVAVQVAVHLYEERGVNGATACVLSLLRRLADEEQRGAPAAESVAALDVILDAVADVHLRKDALAVLCRTLVWQVIGPCKRPGSDLGRIFAPEFRHASGVPGIYAPMMHSLLGSGDESAQLRLCWLYTCAAQYLPPGDEWQGVIAELEQHDRSEEFLALIRAEKDRSELAWQLALRWAVLAHRDIRPDAESIARGFLTRLFEPCRDSAAKIGDDSGFMWILHVLASPRRTSRWVSAAVQALRILGQSADPGLLRNIQLPEPWIEAIREKVRGALEDGTVEAMLSRLAGTSKEIRQSVGYFTLAALDVFIDTRPSLTSAPRSSNYEVRFNLVYQSLFSGSGDLDDSFRNYLKTWAPGLIWEAEGSQVGPTA